MTNQTDKIKYRPFIYILLVFLITWICAILISIMDYETWGWVIQILDFIESASPLIVSLFLLRKHLRKNNYLFRFFLGASHWLIVRGNKGYVRYIVVAILFFLQFLNFYLFRIESFHVGISSFIMTFIGQLLLGGALEEAGWRGYLQPAFEKKVPVILAALFVNLIWAGWHLPYFFLPGNMHTGGNFPFYIFTTVVTGFILTAIYKLTESVLLCTLFHGWQNTIVMSIPTDMEHLGFITIFILLGIISIVTCVYLERKEQIISH